MGVQFGIGRMNYLFALGALAAFAWAALQLMPLEIPVRPVAALSTTAIASSIDPHADQKVVEARKAPVPFERNVRPSAIAPGAANVEAFPPEQKAEDEQKVRDDLDKKAAKRAVELDGYKGVTIVGRTSSGAWRAKANRGATEVMLIVDGTGRVLTE